MFFFVYDKNVLDLITSAMTVHILLCYGLKNHILIAVEHCECLNVKSDFARSDRIVPFGALILLVGL